MARVEGEGDWYGYTVGKKLVLKFMKAAQYKNGVSCQTSTWRRAPPSILQGGEACF